MLLRLSKIIEVPDSALPFETQLDLHEMQFGGCFPVQEPVAAKFEREVSYPVHCVLTTELENEDEADEWTFLLQDDTADLDEILTTAFVLNMDSKLLCKPDCKGLCFRCGKNLNEGPCDCRAESDPRLAVLEQLLDDKP